MFPLCLCLNPQQSTLVVLVSIKIYPQSNIFDHRSITMKSNLALGLLFATGTFAAMGKFLHCIIIQSF